ncbi:hypothetical protein [Bacillus mycoides]|uniref:hypothetical protein n=1 Tax=Bacillus mycoides TaxID=1405 RepID=UPI001C0303BE|nr:hypothetical protein [Bacillus mycoides]QWG92814.1 hypothetical protein EXW40_27515 [Bacillus mycoides]
MQAPIIVLVVYDYFNGDKDSEVSLFLDMEKAKAHGKKLAKNYLEDNDLTAKDFQGECDTFIELEDDSGYWFNTWLDKTYDKYNVAVYEGKFEDICQ